MEKWTFQLRYSALLIALGLCVQLDSICCPLGDRGGDVTSFRRWTCLGEGRETRLTFLIYALTDNSAVPSTLGPPVVIMYSLKELCLFYFFTGQASRRTGCLHDYESKDMCRIIMAACAYESLSTAGLKKKFGPAILLGQSVKWN